MCQHSWLQGAPRVRSSMCSFSGSFQAGAQPALPRDTGAALLPQQALLHGSPMPPPGEGWLGCAFHITPLVPSSHAVLLLKLKNKVGFLQAPDQQSCSVSEGCNPPHVIVPGRRGAVARGPVILICVVCLLFSSEVHD